MIRREFLKSLLSAPAVVAFVTQTAGAKGETSLPQEAVPKTEENAYERAVREWSQDPETGPYSILRFDWVPDQQLDRIYMRMRGRSGSDFEWCDLFGPERSPDRMAKKAREVFFRVKREHGVSEWRRA